MANIKKIQTPNGTTYNIVDATALHSIPIASDSTLGGVKIPTSGNITIDANGYISAVVDISGKVDVTTLDDDYESHIYNSGVDGILLQSMDTNTGVRGETYVNSSMVYLDIISQDSSVSTVALDTQGVVISSQGSAGVVIHNVVTPTNNTDAANKAYVDGLVSALTNTEIDNAVAAAVTVNNANTTSY